MKKILIVFGTRPEAIKMAPLVKEFKKYPSIFKTIVCVTSQHRQMLDQVLALFAIKPDADLNIMRHNQTLDTLTARAITGVTEALIKHAPDLVLVQGDTTTAMAAALASFYKKIPVGHVEAGLRTHDINNPFPEEANRRIISTIAQFHFTPTRTAFAALLKEGTPPKNVYLTGNTVIDALKTMVKQKNSVSGFTPNPQKRLILVTAHRRENFGEPIKNICSALKKIAETHLNVDIVYPVHLNPNIKGPVYHLLRRCPRIHLIPPVEYQDLVSLIRASFLILTDSGGIQEEAPAFGKPVLVLRKETERPEGIAAGVARLVGTETSSIVKNVERLLTNKRAYITMSKAVNPYGDGTASRRIVSIIQKAL